MYGLPMNTLKQQVMALPPDQRLEHALYLIEELSGRVDDVAGYLRETFSLTAQEIKLVAALNAASPQILGIDQLMAAMETNGTSQMSVRVLISRIRKKSDIKICVEYCFGYYMPEKLDIPVVQLQVHTRPMTAARWSDEDVADLRQMVENGSHVSAIADELNRTERGVLDKIRKMGLPWGPV